MCARNSQVNQPPSFGNPNPGTVRQKDSERGVRSEWDDQTADDDLLYQGQNGKPWGSDRPFGENPSGKLPDR